MDEATDILLTLSEAIERVRAEDDPAARGAAAGNLTRQMSQGVVAAKTIAMSTVQDMRASGLTYREIAEIMGVSKARAYEIGAGLSGGRRSSKTSADPD